eukprot:CAMPEP_0195656800 /NCGR_PEP_ID=MMETSP0815-20121206/35184_1 /TAXON_ID=97485 /ORGANISM="Prymnesium parvum, Strain Texoma1" /LENGTH=54 /DNA_ID=CAMNT_0040801177 /DNA_START=66 /DNA_END=230 /DNA_ORIENTATION=-
MASYKDDECDNAFALLFANSAESSCTGTIKRELTDTLRARYNASETTTLGSATD